jgi:hypothetical protein
MICAPTGRRSGEAPRAARGDTARAIAEQEGEEAFPAQAAAEDQVLAPAVQAAEVAPAVVQVAPAVVQVVQAVVQVVQVVVQVVQVEAVAPVEEAAAVQAGQGNEGSPLPAIANPGVLGLIQALIGNRQSLSGMPESLVRLESRLSAPSSDQGIFVLIAKHS